MTRPPASILSDLASCCDRLRELDAERGRQRELFAALQSELAAGFYQTDEELLETVLACVCTRYSVSRAELMSRSRIQRVADARFEAWWTLHKKHSWTTVKIAPHFNRDRSGISHGIQRHQDHVDAKQVRPGPQANKP